MTTPNQPEAKKPNPQAPGKEKKAAKKPAGPQTKKANSGSSMMVWLLVGLQYVVILGGGYYLYQSDKLSIGTASSDNAQAVAEVATLEETFNEKLKGLESKLKSQTVAAEINETPRLIHDYLALEKAELLGRLAEYQLHYQSDKNGAINLLQEAHLALAKMNVDSNDLVATLETLMGRIDAWQNGFYQKSSLLAELSTMLVDLKLDASNMKFNASDQVVDKAVENEKAPWYERLWLAIKAELPVRRVGRPIPHLSQDEMKLTQARLQSLLQESKSYLAAGDMQSARQAFQHFVGLLMSVVGSQDTYQAWEAKITSIESQIFNDNEPAPDFGDWHQALSKATDALIVSTDPAPETNIPEEEAQL